MGINGNLSSHIGAPEVLNKHKKILQKTHSGTSFSNVDRISTAHFHAPYAPEMHELGVTGSLSAVWPSSDDRFFNNHGK